MVERKRGPLDVISAGVLPGLAAHSTDAHRAVLCVCENLLPARREVLPILQRAGYEVDMIEASTRRPPDLSRRRYHMVLFDICSRNDTPYQVCAQTRLATDIPIMLVLRGAARNEVLRALQSGADAYVLSPFDPRELLIRLSALLRRRPAPAAIL